MHVGNHPAIKVHQFVILLDKLLDRELKKTNMISFSQFMILAAVNFHPGLSQKMIANARQTTEAAVSRHVVSLVKKGFLTTSVNSKDRKVHVLKLSPKGKKLFSQGSQVVEKTMNHVFNQLPKQNIDDLVKSFDIMLTTLQVEFPDLSCQ